jgi:hypothetical protein
MDGRGVMRRDIANLGPRASAAGLRRHVVNIEGVEERWAPPPPRDGAPPAVLTPLRCAVPPQATRHYLLPSFLLTAWGPRFDRQGAGGERQYAHSGKCRRLGSVRRSACG